MAPLQTYSVPQKRTNVRSQVSATATRFPRLAGMLAAELFVTPRRAKRPQREHHFLQSAERHELRSGLACWTWGEVGLAPLVVLVHGWEGRGAQLGAFVAPLLESGYAVATFDARAHGESRGRRATAADFAAGLIELERRFGLASALICHSLGAMAGVIAREQGYRSECMVLIAPMVFPHVAVDSFLQAAGLPPSLHTVLQRRTEARTKIPFDQLALDPLAALLDMPVLIAHDQNDLRIQFAHSEQLARALPHATLLPTLGLGHRRILNDDAVVRRAVSFIHSLIPPFERRPWFALL